MAKEEKTLTEAVEATATKKAQTYVCKKECYINGTRYHAGEEITTDAKLPEYFVKK